MTDDPEDLERILEEIFQRRAAGEQPSIDEYAARHPELAERLRERFETLAILDGLIRQRGSVPPPNTILGDFRIEGELGRGAMGVVFLAEQISLKRLVALKVFDSRLVRSHSSIERFRREAEIAARLRHPNVIAVYAIGESQGYPFFAMEYSRGVNLAQLITHLRSLGESKLRELDLRAVLSEITGAADEEADPSEEETSRAGEPTGYFGLVARIVADAADGLSYAHSRGVIHRDIKPHNILIDERVSPQIADFGLAKDATLEKLSLTGDMLGTPYYMSPEQVAAGRIAVDHRTDIYSLGATLYELLTLRVPFSGGSSHEVLRKILVEPAPSLRSAASHVPRDLQVIALKALEKNPDHRYATAREMAEDLRRFLRYEPVRARAPGAATVVRRFFSRHRVASLAAAATLATVAVVAVVIGEVRGAEQLRSSLAQAQAAANEGSLRAALDILDRMPPALAAATECRALAESVRAENDRLVASYRTEIEGGIQLARAGFLQGWGGASAAVTNLMRLRYDSAQFEPLIREAIGPFPVLLRAVPAGARVHVRPIHPFTGALGALREVEPTSGSLPLFEGSHRITIVTADAVAEIPIEVERGQPAEKREVTVRLVPTAEASRGMVKIPAGEYPIGWDGTIPSETIRLTEPSIIAKRPARVRLAAFLIDRTLVTNAEFARFVEATGHRSPVWWQGSACPEGSATKPVIGVSWSDAAAFAAWTGKRLPTEDEYEAAARGPQGFLYPWGDSPPPDSTRAHLDYGNREAGSSRMATARDLLAADALPAGATPTGLLQMLGNAHCWVWNRWEPRKGADPRKWPWTAVDHVMRSAASDNSGPDINATLRMGKNTESVAGSTGIRCAKTVWPIEP